MEDIARYWREQRRASAPDAFDFLEADAPCVDDITWNDLDMDAIFQALNRAQSSVGEEALYAMLRNIGVGSETLDRRVRWMNALAQEEEGRVALQLRLSALRKTRFHDVYALLFRPEHKAPAHGWVYPILAGLPVLFLGLSLVAPFWLAGVAASFLLNLFIFYRTQSLWGSQLTGIRQLAAVFDCARRLSRHTIPGMKDLTDELSPLCAKLKPIARWNALFVMQGMGDLSFLTEYIRIAFQLDMLSFTRLIAFICHNQPLVARLYALVGELDACIAVASVRASLPVSARPEFTEAVVVNVKELAHPLLSRPVRNSMDWRQNALITGSNASGKSTFVKALAVNAILAQSLCLCWAEHFRLPRSKVMSSMALRDHLQEGDSYFIVEIKSLRRILSALTPERPTLCFVDEILRGTNTVERIASSSALLRYLNGQNALCIAATHDVELTQLLLTYRQYHFREEMTPQGMTFSYRLMDGPCATRNAIRLLEQMEFPGEIVAWADKMAIRFDESGQWEFADAD